MPTPEQLNNLREVFSDPIVQNKLVDLVTSKKPKGWSRRSNAPYYKQYYAEAIKKEIDKMLVDRVDIIYDYKTFCGENEELMAKNTLYARINQSIHFLLDCLDPQGVYKAWYEVVRITQEKGRGISIRFAEDFRREQKEIQSPKPIMATQDVPLWKRRMDTWLESDDVTPFVMEPLCLSDVEVAQIREELNGLDSVMAHVENTFIKIMRIG
jgi:hypothetical protein